MFLKKIILKGSQYWYLTELAAETALAKRMVQIIFLKENVRTKSGHNGEGHCYPCMGCRSFLTTYEDENGKPKYYGRFNQGVIYFELSRCDLFK